MPESASADRVRYTAVVRGVREVTLAGSADLEFWRRVLDAYALEPHAAAGGAQLMISASALRWHGRAFRELIVVVATCRDRAVPQPDSFFLAGGCNTSRLFAWTERRLFHTPYRYGDVAVDADAPALELRYRRQSIIRARSAAHRASAAWSDAATNGPVFLPGYGSAHPPVPRFFYVALSGRQAIYPFAADADDFAVTPSSAHPVSRWLAESGFAPTEWRIRAGATHARSQTFAAS